MHPLGWQVAHLVKTYETSGATPHSPHRQRPEHKEKDSYRYEEKGGRGKGFQNEHRVRKAFPRVTRNPKTVAKKPLRTIVVFYPARQVPGQF